MSSAGKYFKDFSMAFLRSDVSIDDGYAVIKVAQDIDVQYFVRSLKEFGLVGEININSNELVFPLETSSFSDESLIFSSMATLWRFSCGNAIVPDEFVVIKEKITSLSECEEINSMQQFVAWRAVLRKIKSHELESKVIWYLPNDDGGKEIIISVHESYLRAKQLEFKKSSLDSAKKLLAVLSLDDAQENERKLILKKAVSDFLSENGTIDEIILAGERIYNRYNDLLDLYTKRFSVSKILSDIESKNLEYTTKINDFISSSQSKAFTIPGALIAVGALTKTSGFWESILVIIGLYMVYYITRTSNDVQRESYENLRSGLDETFSRYQNFDEGAEVNKAATRTHASLRSKIDKASGRLNGIDTLGKAMICIGAIYLLIK